MKKIVRTLELTWETTESTTMRRSSSTRTVNQDTEEGESIEPSACDDRDTFHLFINEDLPFSGNVPLVNAKKINSRSKTVDA